ncbi:MAG: hypothetical protein FJ102_12045 [Deltaproteobacteria bacterium]|nr:hypothetical protein [Deltaproteobacteria bacterium]
MTGEGDPALAITSALVRDRGGVAVVYVPDLGLLDWTAADVVSLWTGGTSAVRVASVAEALAHPHDLVLFLPTDERAAVVELDGRRDQLLASGRTAPLVLFLLRDGPGAAALLGEAPSLWSIVVGNDVDPEDLAQQGAAAASRAFAAEGVEPEEVVARWRAGTWGESADDIATLYRAILIAGRGRTGE